MNAWIKRGVRTALLTGGFLAVGTGIASADDSTIDVTVPVTVTDNAVAGIDLPDVSGLVAADLGDLSVAVPITIGGLGPRPAGRRASLVDADVPVTGDRQRRRRYVFFFFVGLRQRIADGVAVTRHRHVDVDQEPLHPPVSVGRARYRRWSSARRPTGRRGRGDEAADFRKVDAGQCVVGDGDRDGHVDGCRRRTRCPSPAARSRRSSRAVRSPRFIHTFMRGVLL